MSSVARTGSDATRARSNVVPLPPILHFSSQEPFTKYEMCLEFAKILDLPIDHITPIPVVPEGVYLYLCVNLRRDVDMGVDATPRPVNTWLDIVETEQRLGITLEFSGFAEWWTERLKGPHLSSPSK
jgi:S-adenosylmethionine synthetase